MDNSIFTMRDNMLTFISLFQCFAIFVGSIFMLTHTISSLPYFFAFVSGVLSMLSLQCFEGLYEKGPFRGNYNKTMPYYNRIIMASAFSLLISMFMTVFQLYPNMVFVYALFGVYVIDKLQKFYELTGR